jgi:hypothetical protein
MTAAEEDRMRRKAAVQAAEVRRIYEEMVLKKPAPAVVQIGSMDAIKQGGNGSNGNSNTTPTEARQPEPVAGD